MRNQVVCVCAALMTAVSVAGETKISRFLQERVFGSEARGSIYEETVEAFRTHYDDCHPVEKGRENAPKKGLWQGEYWGKTMLSAAVVCDRCGTAELKGWLRTKALAFVKEFQREDGYLGTYADADFVGVRGADGTETFCWNLWGRKYTMWALIELARVTETPALLEAAGRMMDHEIAQLDRLGVKLVDTGFFAGLPSMSVLKPLLVLYRATGRTRYRDFAARIVRDWDRAGNPMPNLIANAFGDRPVHDWYPQPERWAKAYEMMSCLEGLVDWAQQEKDARVLEAVRRIVAKLERDELNAVFSVGFFDHFVHASACRNTTTEPCDVTHWIRLCRDLFGATDDPHYLDLLEKAYLNAFLAGVYRDGKWGAHSVRSHGSRHRTAPHQVGMRFHQCCIDNMPRTFMDVLDAAATVSPDGILSVNLYSDAKVSVGDREVTIEGGYPVADGVRVTIASPRAGRVRFRRPDSMDAMTVDGREAVERWLTTELPAGTRTYEVCFARTPRILAFAAEGLEAPTERMFETSWETPEMRGLGRKTPGLRIQYGPILLAKGLYAGTPSGEIFRDRLGDGRGWKLSVTAGPRTKTSGSWTLTLEKAGERVALPVGDFASIADADDAENRFSIWF